MKRFYGAIARLKKRKVFLRGYLIGLMVLLAAQTLTVSAEETYDYEEVIACFAAMLHDAAGTEESGFYQETSKYDAVVLEEMDQWFVRLTDDFVVLTTLDGTYAITAERQDGMMILAKALAYRYVFSSFVEEEILILSERSDIGSFTVSDSNFDEYVTAVEELGYGPIYGEDSEAFAEALREELEGEDQEESRSSDFESFQNDSFGIAPPFGKFQNDSFGITVVPGGGSEGEEDSYYIEREEDDSCSVCYGTGNCQTCYGRGYYFNPYDLTQKVECACGDGKCSSCDGKG